VQQRKREKEIYAKLHIQTQKTAPIDSSDEEKSMKGLGFPKSKKVFSSMSRTKLGSKKPFDGKKNVDRKNLKKNHKRRSTGLKAEPGKVAVETDGRPMGVKSDSPGKKASPRKNIRRKSTTDGETEEEEGPDPASLRSWIDTYEEAVTNHYSPELRSRLQAVKLPANFFKPKDINGIR
jgi:histone-lysine N-methyltransferase MLL5